MPIINLEALPSFLSPPARLLGLDSGSVRQGCAISDPQWMIASPLPMLEADGHKQTLSQLLALLQQQDARALICGLPLDMSGQENENSQRVRRFVKAVLTAQPSLPVAFFDERFSTAAVERAMIAADMSRAKRGRKIDSAAAAYILQGALDLLRRVRDGGGL